MRLGCNHGATHKIVIGINVAVFTLEAVSGQRFLATFALWPVGHFLWPSSLAGRLQGVAADHVRLSSREFSPSGDQHVRAWMFGSDVERAIVRGTI